MRSIQVAPASVLLGVGIAATMALLMSQAAHPASAIPVCSGSQAIQANTMLHIDEGSPYTVPAGRLFVLTGVGTRYFPNAAEEAQFRINGNTEAAALYVPGASSSMTSVVGVPSGLTAPAGAVLSVHCVNNPGQGFARAWGYLAPQ